MNLFERGDLNASLRATTDEIKKEIDKLSNEVICSTDMDELEEYYVAKYQIEEIDLLKDNITKELSETKVKVYNHFYRGGYRDFEPEYYMIDGYRVIFTIPFDGDKNLLDLSPSSFYIQSFPVDRVIAPTENDYGKILYSLEFPKKELQQKENSNDFVEKKFNQVNILAVRNHDSGNMETSIPERKPPLIGLLTIDKKLSECQAQSRFAGRKPALHL